MSVAVAVTAVECRQQKLQTEAAEQNKSNKTLNGATKLLSYVEQTATYGIPTELCN